MSLFQRVDTARTSAPFAIGDRQPPHNVEAELGVLGSILLLPEVFDDVALVVKKEDFYSDAHQMIYHQLAEMVREGKRIDITLLVERLKTAGELELVGGMPYLGSLVTAVPHAAHAKDYAEVVKQKSSLRRLISASTEILRDAYDSAQDPKHLLSQAEQKIFQILEDQGTGAAHELNDILQNALIRIDERMKRGENSLSGVRTGFTDLNKMLGGLHKQELLILAARPSMGKTALALNIAEYVAVNEQTPVLFVSLEMGALELGERLLCSAAQVNGQRLRNGDVTNEARRALMEKAGEISQSPLYVDDHPSRTITEIAAIARRLQRKKGLGLIVIDYLQLIEPDNPRDPRQEQVAKIARRLKVLAREISVPVLCLAQLNRQAEASRDNKPRLSHLRESGAIEQDADVVMFIHREEYYLNSEEEKARVKGQAELIIAKQRNGPVGEVPLSWSSEFTRFGDAALHKHDDFKDYGSTADGF